VSVTVHRIDVWEVVQAQRAARYRRALTALRTASLPRLAALTGESLEKQEGPRSGFQGPSTAHVLHEQEARAASAHSATYGR
jgi:hypothetical protein